MRWLRYLAIVNGAIVLILLGSALLGDDGIIRHERLSEELRRIRSINQDFTEKNQQLRKEASALRMMIISRLQLVIEIDKSISQNIENMPKIANFWG